MRQVGQRRKSRGTVICKTLTDVRVGSPEQRATQGLTCSRVIHPNGGGHRVTFGTCCTDAVPNHLVATSDVLDTSGTPYSKDEDRFYVDLL